LASKQPRSLPHDPAPSITDDAAAALNNLRTRLKPGSLGLDGVNGRFCLYADVCTMIGAAN